MNGPCSEEVTCCKLLCFRNPQGLLSATKLAVAVPLMSESSIASGHKESNLGAPLGTQQCLQIFGFVTWGERGAAASSGWRSGVQLHILQSAGQPLTTELSDLYQFAGAAVTK